MRSMVEGARARTVPDPSVGCAAISPAKNGGG